MKHAVLAALVLGASFPVQAQAQEAAVTQTISGTRLDVTATGEVTRVPDVAIITAGVVSHSTSASGALQDSAQRMQRVLAALRGAGVADRDIQTNNVNLNPEYRYDNGQAAQLVGYTANNNVTVRFRDIRTSGKILDALVGQGANQINGPALTIDQPDAALDEARAKAVALGKARAELYAHALGMRIARVVSVSEAGNFAVAPIPLAMAARKTANTTIEAGEQKLQVSVAMTFELQ